MRELSRYPIKPHAAWLELGADSAERRWLELGADSAERRRRYAELLEQGVTDEDSEKIRRCTRKGLPAGSEQFREQIERALAVRLGDGRRGRPSNRRKKGLKIRALTPFSWTSFSWRSGLSGSMALIGET
jgi:hypothetical protein